MRMAHIGSYICMPRLQRAELLKGISRCGLLKEGVAMLEELCHWRWAFMFQKSHTRSSFFLFLSLSPPSLPLFMSLFSLSLYMYVPLPISLCSSVCVAFPFCLLPENQDVKFSDTPLYHDHPSMSPHHDDKGPSLQNCKQDQINAFLPKSCLGHDAFSQQQNSKIIGIFLHCLCD